MPALRYFWAAYAFSQVALAGYIFYSHLWFPLNLEFMESTVLQHVLRLAAGQPIYVDPSPDFVALAYNPLYYVACLPFLSLFGPGLAAIRVPAILGTIAAAGMIGLLLHRLTRSKWWAAIGVGIFAAAYRVMDSYLDIGHRDSLLLLSILTGFWFLHRGGRFGPILGMLALATGFWFKQTGVYFLAMGICYALWQYPWPRAVTAALAGLALGPLLYIFAPDAWWGPRLHYFTFEVPSHWTDLRLDETTNLVRLLVWHYAALLCAAGWLWVRGWTKKTGSLGILRIAIPGALASGVAVMMTAGSSNNVYIPMGTLLIIGGVTGLSRLSRAGMPGRRLAYSLLALAFAPLLYNPAQAMRPNAEATYAEFVDLLGSLDGPVYGPGFGPFFPPPGHPNAHFTPLAHVVPMADLVRGRGRDEAANPLIPALLRSVAYPAAPTAYILSHSTLEDEPALAYLKSRYTLEKDFGTRFEPLATLPARHGHLYPRYLYRSIQSPGRDAMAKGNTK